MDRGTVIEAHVKDIGDCQVLGVCDSGMRIWLQGDAVPGDRVRAEVIRSNKNFHVGRVSEILQCSPDRVEAPCPHYGECPGCHLQALSYDLEGKFKSDKIQQALGRIGGFHQDAYEFRPIQQAEREYGYRNKVDLSISGHQAGYHSEGSIISIRDCLLAEPNLREALGFFLYWIRERLPADHRLNRLILRSASHSGKVNVMLRGELSRDQLNALTESCREHPLISGMAIQRRPGRPWDQLLGDGQLTQVLAGVPHTVYHNEFFQVNHAQAEWLVNECMTWLAELAPTKVLDLFCGVGTFSYPAGRIAANVVGIDLTSPQRPPDPAADHVGFIAWDLGRGLPREAVSQSWDTVILDPPRAGIRPQLADQFRDQCRPRHLLYVSCNPSTLARDCKRICEDGRYQLKRVQGIDLFPRTTHVETMVLLERMDQDPG